MDEQANIEWVRDGMRLLNEQLQEMRSDVRDVRDRLIRIESTNLHTEVEVLRGAVSEAHARIDAMKEQYDRATGRLSGMGAVAEWLYRLAPWFVSAAAMVVALYDR